MKKRIAGLMMGTLLAAALAVTGCGNTTAADMGKTETTAAAEAAEPDTAAALTQESTDAAASQDPMEYLDGRYSFNYHPSDFTAFEGADHKCTVSYTNENVQAAGSNTISVSLKENTTYDKELESVMSGMGVTDYTISECNFGADGIAAYSVSYAPAPAAGSELKTTDDIFAIPDGQDVIMIDVFHTVSPDENSEMAVSDAVSYVLDTFALMHTN